MQIAFRDSDRLTKLLTITVTPEDYRDKAEAELKRLKKQLQLPGFRPGTVPENIIHRRFGTDIVAKEVQSIFQKGIDEGLAQLVNYLGEPLAVEGQSLRFDINNLQKNYEYTVEIGAFPAIEIPPVLSEVVPIIEAYKIIATNDGIDNELEQIIRHYSTDEEFETGEVTENDSVEVTFIPLNDDNTIREDGMRGTTWLVVKYIADEDARTAILQNGIGAEYTTDDVWSLWENNSPSDKRNLLQRIFNYQEADIETISPKFLLNVINGKRKVAPELTEEFFEKNLPNAGISNETELRTSIKQRIEAQCYKYSNAYLMKKVQKLLMESCKFELPDEYLVQWLWTKAKIEEQQKGKLGKTVKFETTYKEYLNSINHIKWDIVSQSLIESQNIDLSIEEIKEGVWLELEYRLFKHNDIDDAQRSYYREIYREIHEEWMNDEKVVSRATKKTLEDKLINLVIDQANILEEKVSMAEFYQIMREEKEVLTQTTAHLKQEQLQIDTEIAQLKDENIHLDTEISQLAADTTQLEVEEVSLETEPARLTTENE